MNKRDLNTIHDELLTQVPETYQKSEGFPMWDLLRGAAYGLKLLWAKALWVESQLDVGNLTGSDLERFVYQRKGLNRRAATKAVGEITIKTGSGRIKKGDVFSTKGGIKFRAIEDAANAIPGTAIHVEAMVAGAAGNVPAGSVTQMPVTIEGIAEVYNAKPFQDGYEAESDIDLRERYYAELREPVTSGNVYHYRRWAKEVPGVQDVKVFPLWQGDNTVQVVVIDTDGHPANGELVKRVQDHIDPGKAGTGQGEAPIGAHCTVSAADTFKVNVSVSIIATENLEAVKKRIRENLEGFFRSIAFTDDWVSVGKVNNTILTTKGVSDCDKLRLNGGTARLPIPEKAVAQLGEVIISEI